MKNKPLILIMALMLCVGAFLFPTAAYATTDNTPPTVRAWINGDLLHVEAFDDTGVESAYINSARVNYRVDGSFDLLLRDYAGSDEYITVYAVDFAGNKSNVVELKNPYYTAPTVTPTPAPATPAPAQTPAATATPSATSTPSPAPTETPEPETEPTQSAVPAEQEAFTPDGTGTVVDNIVEQNGKEFFTITTAEDNVFYLIIDRARDSENVYLLNAVTEDDLMALAEKSGGTSQSAIPTPAPEVTPTPEPTPEPEPEAPAKDSNNGGMILIVLLVVAGAGIAGYYFKVMKPRQEAAASPDEFDDDEDDDDMEYEDEPEYPDYPDMEEYPEDTVEPETEEE